MYYCEPKGAVSVLVDASIRERQMQTQMRKQTRPELREVIGLQYGRNVLGVEVSLVFVTD